MKKLLIVVLIAGVMGLMLGIYSIPQVNAVVPGINQMVSVNNTGNGQGGNNYSGSAFDFSANGRYVAFDSVASDLVSGDTNNKRDIFVRDLDNGTTVRASISATGVQANDESIVQSGAGVAISESGRYIAFTSQATNLIDGQSIPNTYQQIYIRDMVTNNVSLVTQKPDGTLGNGGNASVRNVSNDGRFVVWEGRKNTNLVPGGSTGATVSHLYLADRSEGTFTLLSPQDGSSVGSTADTDSSCDGSLMVFSSSAQHDTTDTDGAYDIFLVDNRNGLKIRSITALSSVNAFNSSISCNGNYIVFQSADSIYSSLVSSGNTKAHSYLYDRINETVSIIDTTTTGTLGNDQTTGYSGVDNQGNVAFSSQSKNFGAYPAQPQMYLKTKKTGALGIISRTMFDPSQHSNGVIGNIKISSDGERVVYKTGNPTNSIYAPATANAGNWGMYDSNNYSDVVMSLTGL